MTKLPVAGIEKVHTTDLYINAALVSEVEQSPLITSKHKLYHNTSDGFQ